MPYKVLDKLGDLDKHFHPHAPRIHGEGPLQQRFRTFGPLRVVSIGTMGEGCPELDTLLNEFASRMVARMGDIDDSRKGFMKNYHLVRMRGELAFLFVTFQHAYLAARRPLVSSTEDQAYVPPDSLFPLDPFVQGSGYGAFGAAF